MKTLAELLCENKDSINAHLFLGNVKWKNLVTEKRLSGDSVGRDEQLWTFLAACGYAIAGSQGVRRITKILTGTDFDQPDLRIWLEAMPMPPRKQEGNTHLYEELFASLPCSPISKGLEEHWKKHSEDA